MLSEIVIENLAVIEKAQISFGPGFTVLTGETGAGKSIMIDSINAILGNRTSKDLVRSGADKARILASFQNVSHTICQKLEELGYPAEEDLILQREISLEGKSQCRINGMPATAAVLKELGAQLIQIHGQHDNHSLTSENKHLPLLDLYAAHEQLLQQYQVAYRQWQTTKKECEALQFNEAEKTRKIELLRYEIEEIEHAQLQKGEEESLLDRRNRQRNAQALMESLYSAKGALEGGDDGEDGAVTLLGIALGQIESAASIAAPLSEMADTMRDLYYATQELERELQHSIHRYEEDDVSLDELEARLDQLYRLKQKYGSSIEAVMLYQENALLELNTIEGAEEQLKKLRFQLSEHQKMAQDLADKLSKSRLQAFKKFSKEIQDSLQFLNMSGAKMALRHEKTSLGPNGEDEMEFLFSANLGEEPKPLAKIASGGELSRVMLAIKNALAQRDDMPTVIYDEIDVGISGQTAGQIGQVLWKTACERQVLCVTHTAQIAAYADEHLFISKNVEQGRTFTNIQKLSEQARANELARIISGEQMTSTAKANAGEMLASAHTIKIKT